MRAATGFTWHVTRGAPHSLKLGAPTLLRGCAACPAGFNASIDPRSYRLAELGLPRLVPAVRTPTPPAPVEPFVEASPWPPQAPMDDDARMDEVDSAAFIDE